MKKREDSLKFEMRKETLQLPNRNKSDHKKLL